MLAINSLRNCCRVYSGVYNAAHKLSISSSTKFNSTANVPGPQDKHEVDLIANKLFSLGFHNDQIETLTNALFQVGTRAVRDPAHLEAIFWQWKQGMRPTEAKFDWQSKDYSTKVTIHEVLANVEPRLMMANPDFIEKRMKDLLELDMVDNRKDLWRIFFYAPAAFYLQEWDQLMRKYCYLNFRVFPWLYNKHERKNLRPHPLVRFARVFEPSLDHIRTRFIFAQRTGLNTVTASSTVRVHKRHKDVDLGVLILADLDAYLRLVAPGCRREEYETLERLLIEFEEEDEDIELYAQMAELNVVDYDPLPPKPTLKSTLGPSLERPLELKL